MSNFHSAELNRLMAQQQAEMNSITSESVAFDEGSMAEAVEIDYAELLDRARETAQPFEIAGFHCRDDFEEAADEFVAKWADRYQELCRKEKNVDLQVRRFKAARKLSL